MRMSCAVFLAAALTFGLAGWVLAPEVDRPQAVDDDLTAVVVVPANPCRLLALTPALTELLYALGLAEKVVGATDWADYPPEAGMLPRIGVYHNPNIEKIIALAPDLVLASGLGNPPWVVSRLRSIGIPVYATWIRDPNALPEDFRKIGELCGAASAGRELAARMESQFRWVQQRLKGVVPRTTLFVLGMNPVVSAGKGTITDQLITMAGGLNIARDAPGNWPRLDRACIVDASPQVILLSTMEKNGDLDDKIRCWKGMRGVGDRPGVIIRAIDPDLVDRPGPRLGEGLIEMAAAIHPELFKGSSFSSTEDGK